MVGTHAKPGRYCCLLGLHIDLFQESLYITIAAPVSHADGPSGAAAPTLEKWVVTFNPKYAILRMHLEPEVESRNYAFPASLLHLQHLLGPSSASSIQGEPHKGATLKKCMLLVRAVYAYVRLMPAYKVFSAHLDEYGFSSLVNARGGMFVGRAGVLQVYSKTKHTKSSGQLSYELSTERPTSSFCGMLPRLSCLVPLDTPPSSYCHRHRNAKGRMPWYTDATAIEKPRAECCGILIPPPSRCKGLGAFSPPHCHGRQTAKG